MPQKVVIIADPGIDAAFAIALALNDPQLDVVGLIATAGNVSAKQATLNCHILIDQLDPAKWPRVGTALPIDYEIEPGPLHGPGGLGGCEFPCAVPHQQAPSDRLLLELIRMYPHELAIIVLGPCTMLASAMDRDPELLRLVDRVVVMGGTHREAGNAGPVAEFHFACDPIAARQVIRSQAHIHVIPLDVMHKLILSPTDLLELPNPESKTSQFLRKIAPYGIRASSNTYGIEGFPLNSVLGVIAVASPQAISFREMHMDIETRGELTRGMSVIDEHPQSDRSKNVMLATHADMTRIRIYIDRTLSRAT